MEFEQQHPIQAQRIYLSLGDREERTRNATMAAVGDNIRALHRELAGRGKDCTLELEQRRAFQGCRPAHGKGVWMGDGGYAMNILIDCRWLSRG